MGTKPQPMKPKPERILSIHMKSTPSTCIVQVEAVDF